MEWNTADGTDDDLTWITTRKYHRLLIGYQRRIDAIDKSKQECILFTPSYLKAIICSQGNN